MYTSWGWTISHPHCFLTSALSNCRFGHLRLHNQLNNSEEDWTAAWKNSLPEPRSKRLRSSKLRLNQLSYQGGPNTLKHLITSFLPGSQRAIRWCPRHRLLRLQRGLRHPNLGLQIPKVLERRSEAICRRESQDETDVQHLDRGRSEDGNLQGFGQSGEKYQNGLCWKSLQGLWRKERSQTYVKV